MVCPLNERDDEYYLGYLPDYLDELIDDLAIPHLGRYGVKPSAVSSLAGEAGIKNNPVNLYSHEMEQILASRLGQRDRPDTSRLFPA